MTRIFRLVYTLHEPMFHASREFGGVYMTEPVLTAHGQAYALGWAASPYRLPGERAYKPDYATELKPVQEKGWYVTPARPEGEVRFRTERFNAQGEGFMSRMAQGAVVDDLELLLNPGRISALNRPQTGSIRFVARGTKLISWAFAFERAPEFPRWVRLGKSLAKARLETVELSRITQKTGRFSCPALLSPLDLPDEVTAERYDVIGIRPVSLLRNVLLSGPYLNTPDGDFPRGMAFITE